MKKALLHCVQPTTWAFTAVLASTSAFGAEAVAPWLSLEQPHNYPCLAWPNVPGHTYSIQTREWVAGGDWSAQGRGTAVLAEGRGATFFKGVAPLSLPSPALH